MKSTLRIVYMGTPGFAVEPLKVLLEDGYNIVSVVTVPDKPAGRGRELKPSEIKQFALEHSLPVLQPEKLRD
ncbi:MAG: methionyl-tRNA formyltransferase, partial [Prevotellaceae bacterium]|nr:methionyl-tRNA formyltransferase [Prevotellaceae bacterium]